MTVSSIPQRTYLRIEVMVADKSGADIIALRFNGDSTATHYGWLACDEVPNITSDASDSEIELLPANVAGGHLTTVEVYNSAEWKRVITSTNGGASKVYHANGVWLVADILSSITVFTLGGQTMSAGTKVLVFGAD